MAAILHQVFLHAVWFVCATVCVCSVSWTDFSDNTLAGHLLRALVRPGYPSHLPERDPYDPRDRDRDLRDSRDPRDPRDRDPRDLRDPRDRDPRDLRDSRPPPSRDLRDLRDIRHGGYDDDKVVGVAIARERSGCLCR
jgi:hypothetical protein